MANALEWMVFQQFFKLFWGKLKYFILRGLNYVCRVGEMSTSLRTCIISCLPKGDKPHEYLKNWQPISLLSVLYKLASATVAKSQTGFMSGRFIGESTRLAYDIMHYVDKNNLQCMLMLIHFQKAFDSVSWSFL